MISVIIPSYNSLATLRQCLEGVHSSTYADYECIVVDDGSTDGSVALAKEFPCQVLGLNGGPRGPAHARNEGAKIARGDILFFIDSDVVIHPETLQIAAEAFETSPETSALFGSYDETPSEGEFISQYKNLLHHFVHQQAHENASTFWSGCGAVRREVFSKVGGFDAVRYPRPSIEDIELGLRMSSAGYEIKLNKAVQAKHLKHWSMSNLIKTDILYRAIPWTQLILQYRNVPNDLNLRLSQRLSSALLLALIGILGWAGLFLPDQVVLLPLLVALFVVLFSGWRLSGGFQFIMSPARERMAFLLMGLITALALFQDLTMLVAPFVLLVPLALLSPALSHGNPRLRQVLYGGMMLVILAEVVLLLVSYPVPLIVSLFVVLGLILLLNLPLYAFFARQRGYVFALAAIPLQLLYYLYSGVVFVGGSVVHFWNTRVKGSFRLAR